MENQSFRVKYIGNERLLKEDIEDALADSELTNSELWEIEEKKKNNFLIHYLGVDRIELKSIDQALIKANIDEEGVLKIKEIKPIYEICEACGGIGNVDEAAGFSLDCIKCGGSGWIKK